MIMVSDKKLHEKEITQQMGLCVNNPEVTDKAKCKIIDVDYPQ